MITNNVFQRVFYLNSDTQTGTCFTVDFEKKQYFVTAKHLVKNIKTGDKIKLLYKNVWDEFEICSITHHDTFDVSIFVINILLLAHPLEPTIEGLTYGQDLYFLGFPYGYYTDIGDANRGYPLPLVKKGILSNMLTKNQSVLLIDGHNNLGFSGGLVVFKRHLEQDFYMAGVVVGFYKEQDLEGEILENTNSGIIEACNIKHVLELIQKNPFGLPIK